MEFILTYEAIIATIMGALFGAFASYYISRFYQKRKEKNQHRQKKVNLLFLDECYSDPVDNASTTISSITGLLVPVEDHEELLAQFHELLKWKTNQRPRILGRAPELHGRDFLREESDERKFQVLEDVVKLINDSRIEIFRLGFYVTKSLSKSFPDDPKLIGICWSNFLRKLQPVFADDLLLPVMDLSGPNTIRKLSQPVNSLGWLRSHGFAPSIENSDNIIGEVFYSDTYSP